MNKKVSFATISVLSFIVSACFTIALFSSNSTTKLAILLMVITALVFEMAKWSLLWEGFSGKHESVLSTVLVILWVGVTSGSIVASCGYVLNESNSTENIAHVSSTQYKQAEQARNIRIDTYNQMVAEIEQLRKQADELPKNYITMKKNIMDQVDRKSTELSSISTEINKPITVTGELPINGYTAFFNMIGEIIGEDPKKISLWFFMVIGVILELIANVFAYLYQKEKNHVHVDKEPETSSDTKFRGKYGRKFMLKKGGSAVPAMATNNIVPFKVKNHVHVDENPKTLSTSKFQSSSSSFAGEFTDEDVQRYMECMYATRFKNGDSRGFRSIGESLDMPIAKAEKIKGHLETLGVVKVVGNRTRIIKEA